MRLSASVAILLMGLTLELRAGETTCETSPVVVDAPDVRHSELVCSAVDQVQHLFARCDLPALSGGLRVDVVEDLRQDCVALYHCGEKWIEILTPDAMATRRDPDGAFAFLELEDYFRSVVVHELTHSAFDDVPCPFEACVTADEYVAYAMQVMSLSEEQRAAFESRAGLTGMVSRDELNVMILFMAPHLFARKDWVHLTQRPDSCAFLRQILDGSVLLDREHF